MQRIEAIVAHEDGTDEWSEVWERAADGDPRQVAERVIANFNATLTPHERRRRLVRVVSTADSHHHDWRKTNLVTQMDSHGQYDSYYCARCGITGERRTLAGDVRRDHRYRAKKYAECRVPNRG